MAFHLGKIEVRSRSPGDEILRVMEEEQTEIDEARGGGFTVDADMPFGEMPSTGPDEERRDLRLQPIFLALRTHVHDGAAHGIAEVRLALHDVPPRRRVRILEIGHERLRPRVKRIDHHLSIDGPGDLDPATAP